MKYEICPCCKQKTYIEPTFRDWYDSLEVQKKGYFEPDNNKEVYCGNCMDALSGFVEDFGHSYYEHYFGDAPNSLFDKHPHKDHLCDEVKYLRSCYFNEVPYAYRSSYSLTMHYENLCASKFNEALRASQERYREWSAYSYSSIVEDHNWKSSHRAYEDFKKLFLALGGDPKISDADEFFAMERYIEENKHKVEEK